MSQSISPAGEPYWSDKKAPITKAGRRLFTDNEPMDMYESDGVTWEDVCAIEAEVLAADVLALDDGVGGVWVHHTPSKPVVLRGHPSLGGRFCRIDGADWPCVTVREYLTVE